MRLKETVLKTARDFIHFSERLCNHFDYVQYIRLTMYSHWSQTVKLSGFNKITDFKTRY